MKHFGFTVSILNNSNRIVSSSEVDWSHLREASSIKFGDDSSYYTVAKISPFFYIQDFTIIDSNTLKINNDIGINLLQHDKIDLSYKEFEIRAIKNLIDSGKNYKTGDILYFKNDKVSISTIDNQPNMSTFIVSEVNSEGTITKLVYQERGKYLVCPDSIIELSGGLGQGAKIEVDFKVTDNRSILEREISKIETNPDFTLIKLNYPVPNGVIEGKLSSNKWEATLSTIYTHGDKLNSTYHVLRDFTPNIGLPLLVKGNPNFEHVYNEAVKKIDKELAEIKVKLFIK